MEFLTTMTGAVLSASCQVLFERLLNGDLRNYARESRIWTDLNKLKTKLETISLVLDKAEEWRMTDKAVEAWYVNLKDVNYELEDVLDEFNFEVMRRKLQADSQADASKAWKMIHSCFTRLNPSVVKFNFTIVSKMENVTKRFEEVTKQIKILKLNERIGGMSSRVEANTLQLPTTSLVNEAEVWGREQDHKAILALMNAEAGDGGILVIPIVGMPGVGKTTLAQLIYNDPSLQFDIKAWNFVGEDFDAFTLTKTILQSNGRGKSLNPSSTFHGFSSHSKFEGHDLDSLQQKLKEKLFGKKFLIVLDDLWNKDYNKWTLFYRPLEAGAPGSRIIITTQDRDVAYMCGGFKSTYPLKTLPFVDCLSVFVHHALGTKDFHEHLELKEVGEEIVDKCQGLPSAVKVIGGLLRGKPNRSAWERVLKSETWMERGDIIPSFRLSYYHLPSHLKRCFSYCGMFPKGYQFSENHLVLRWMAEGCIQHVSEGHEYFNDLVSRSLFERSKSNESLFKMHDVILDLAQFVSRKICCNLDQMNIEISDFSKVRHLAYNSEDFDTAKRFENFHKMQGLRTLLAIPSFGKCYLSSKVLDDMIPRLERLRVLSLPQYAIAKLPDSIGTLKHLRYLGLTSAEIERLPESVSELLSLQTLILWDCKKLLQLPTDLSNLTNLQCLDIRGTSSLQNVPLHLGNLTNLQTLSKFIVGRDDGCKLSELMKISNLRGRLHIESLQNVMNVQDAERAMIIEKQELKELALKWTDNSNELQCEIHELQVQVLQALCPHQKLERLIIKSYGGKVFPSWIGDPSFDKMTSLELCNCHNVMSLPPLGQLPSLKELRLKGMNGVNKVGMELYGNVPSSTKVFPLLEILIIEEMMEWEHWSWSLDGLYGDSDHLFCNLQEFTMRNCPKFVGGFPETLPSLRELNLEGCKEVIFQNMTKLTRLTRLDIKKISGLVSLNKTFIESLVALEDMIIEECDELTHLWDDEVDTDKLECLKQLMIRKCKQLQSLEKGKDMNIPTGIEFLLVSSCEKLEKLPEKLHSLTSLKALTIDCCPNLVTFPNMKSGIEYLYFKDCAALAPSSSNIGEFPDSLKDLEISGGLAPLLQMQNSFSHLARLAICDCPELESFPETGMSIYTLNYFMLWNCRNLRCLPNGIHNLTSLEILVLYDCPAMESFPEGGLPPKLTHFAICYCDKLQKQPMSEWRLNKLTSLENLSIAGAMDMISNFPESQEGIKSLVIPTSVTVLAISGFENLQSISPGIQSLTSLQQLYFGHCPRLRYLPSRGLPESLGSLYITDCPVLEKRCWKGKGKYWPLIAHIPCFSSVPQEDDLSEFGIFPKPLRLQH